MYAQTHAHYRSQAVETAGPAQLVLMLYDGALAALTRARLADGATEAVNRELLKAQDIVSELEVTLDLERGGELAANMAALYRFCLEQILQANLRKDLAKLDGVDMVLRELRDGWEAACCSPAAVGA